jgi:hypothetical protein
MALTRATRGRWPLVFVTLEDVPEGELRALRRFGEVLPTGSLEPAEVAEGLRRRGVGGITAFADGALEPMAQIAEHLDVVHNSVETAHRLVDKAAERAALAAGGLPTPRFADVPADLSPEALRPLTAGFRFPVVIKPAAGVGGRDTVAVGDPDAAVRALQDLRGHHPGRYVVEECLGPYPPVPRDGVADYVSVEVVSFHGRHEIVAVTGRMPLSPPLREGGHFVPAALDADVEAASTWRSSSPTRVRGSSRSTVAPAAGASAT